MASCHTHATLCQSSHRIHRIHRSFWRKIFSHGFHGCAQIRRVWHPAIPTQSPNYLPTEVSGREEPPTDCTDVHRSFWRKIFSHRFHGCAQIRRVWHPCHTHAVTKLSSHRSFWWRSASHRLHGCAQKFLAQDILPQISRMCTD